MFQINGIDYGIIYKVLDSDVISEDEIFMKVLDTLVSPLWHPCELDMEFERKVKVVEGHHRIMLNTSKGNEDLCHERYDTDIFKENVNNSANA